MSIDYPILITVAGIVFACYIHGVIERRANRPDRSASKSEHAHASYRGGGRSDFIASHDPNANGVHPDDVPPVDWHVPHIPIKPR